MTWTPPTPGFDPELDEARYSEREVRQLVDEAIKETIDAMTGVFHEATATAREALAIAREAQADMQRDLEDRKAGQLALEVLGRLVEKMHPEED